MNHPQSPLVKKKSTVIPLRGELYQEFEPAMPKPTITPLIGLIAALGGLAIGAICVYQSPDQVELRSLKSQVEVLTKIKSEVCK